MRSKTSAKFPHTKGFGMNDGVTACWSVMSAVITMKKNGARKIVATRDEPRVLSHRDQEPMPTDLRWNETLLDAHLGVRRADPFEPGLLISDARPGHRKPPPW